MKRTLRLLGASLLVVVLLAAAAVVAVALWVPQKRRAAARGWAESFEPMEAMVARYPSAPNSPAAEELITLSARLRIPLETPRVEGTPQERAQGARERLRRGQEEANRLLPLAAFLGTERSKGSDEAFDPPPAEVAAFLSQHGTDIEAIETHVLDKGPIAWACDIQKGADMPLPPLLGHRELSNVLLIHALEAARTGNDRTARRALDACWKLNLALQDRPELISTVVSAAIAGAHNAVLRRIPAVPGEWQERLSSRDWRRSMLRSFQAEAWMFRRTGERVVLADLDAHTWGSRSVGLVARMPSLGRLWVELTIADHSDHVRRMAVELKDQDPCALDAEAFSRRTEAEIPWWNILSKIAMPNLARAWSVVGRALLDDELTRLVIQTKGEARTTTPAPPSTIPSSVCASMSWMLRPQPNGDLEIEADRNPFKDSRPAPPLRFRVHRRHD